MPESDPNTGVRYATGSDRGSIPQHTKNIVDDIRKQIVPPFANAGARDLAITGSITVNPALGPTTGQMVTVAGYAQIYRGGWKQLLDDGGSGWVTLTMSPNFAALVAAQARVVTGFVELKGLVRHVSAIPTSFVQLTSPNAVLQGISSAYDATTNSGITASHPAMDGNMVASSNVSITARTNGALYIQAGATGPFYVNLNGLKFPL